MATLLDRTKSLLRSDDGPTATEYAVMLSLIVLALFAIVQPVVDGWARLYTTVGQQVGGEG